MKKQNEQDNFFRNFFKKINDFQSIEHNKTNRLILRNKIKRFEFEVIKLSACVDRPKVDADLLKSKIIDLKQQCNELDDLAIK